MDEKLITAKLLRYIQPEAKVAANKKARVNYVNSLAERANIQHIYVNETNFTILTRRKCEHSRKGTRAHITTVLNGCKKINIIHAVSPTIRNVFTEKSEKKNALATLSISL